MYTRHNDNCWENQYDCDIELVVLYDTHGVILPVLDHVTLMHFFTFQSWQA